uniref:Uncharacterized protein n=1 Tax=Glossina pallidipes TaxID=7398 RepID=A0A1A9ZES6_GLOPL
MAITHNIRDLQATDTIPTLSGSNSGFLASKAFTAASIIGNTTSKSARAVAAKSKQITSSRFIITASASTFSFASVLSTTCSPLKIKIVGRCLTPVALYKFFKSSLKSGVLYFLVTSIRNTPISKMKAANFTITCLPEPPMPMFSIWPLGCDITRRIRATCSMASLKNTKLIRAMPGNCPKVYYPKA